MSEQHVKRTRSLSPNSVSASMLELQELSSVQNDVTQSNRMIAALVSSLHENRAKLIEAEKAVLLKQEKANKIKLVIREAEYAIAFQNKLLVERSAKEKEVLKKMQDAENAEDADADIARRFATARV